MYRYGHHLAPTAAVKVRSLHAADLRLQEARQLRGLLVPRARLLRPGGGRRPAPGRACSSPGAQAPPPGCREGRHDPRRPARRRARGGAGGRGRRARRSPRARSRGARCPESLAAAGAHRRGGGRGDHRRRARAIYAGDLVIDRPLVLVGHGRPRLVGSGTGSVVRVRAADVTVEGFDIDGRGGGDLGRDSVGRPRLRRRGATVRDCRDRGRPLRHLPARAPTARRSTAAGSAASPARTPARRAPASTSGTREGFRLTDNEIVDVRDGFYIQSSIARRHPGQRRARPALRRCTTCSPTTTCSRTTSSRTARRARR